MLDDTQEQGTYRNDAGLAAQLQSSTATTIPATEAWTPLALVL